MLQAKYVKLKKKVSLQLFFQPFLLNNNPIFCQKKALQAHKAPKPETEKPIIPKRSTDARDAREVARKLIKSGAIQAIQRPLTKQDQTSFKRPKGQERKRVASDSNVAPYQPFSATQSDGYGPTETDTEAGRVQTLYKQFESERDREERGFGDSKGPSLDVGGTLGGSSSPAHLALMIKSEKKRTGNTIYVSGTRVTEEFLRNHFSVFGKIVNVSMEIEKGRGFITFAKPESTERAIGEMHMKPTAGVKLEVTLARRQPKIEPINDASSSAAWATLGSRFSSLIYI